MTRDYLCDGCCENAPLPGRDFCRSCEQDREPTHSDLMHGRSVASFEGHGDFNSADPWQRYLAHRAAKGY